MKTIKILPKYEKYLTRLVRGTVHFNDVFSEREIDFDAELTVIFRNLGNFSDLTFPIGKNPKLADYGAVLLDELLGEEKRIIKKIKEVSGRVIGEGLPDKAVLSVINCAPRNSKTTGNGKNGKDFHLAITENGVEIYAVPIERLSALETRNKILALFRILNEAHPLFDGKREQFRSSIITTTRYCPEILEPVFQYENRNELIAAKKSGKHPRVIPEQKNLAEIAYIDKFGNIRLSVKDNDEFFAGFAGKGIGGRVKVKIGESKNIIAHYVNSLSEIPEGELGIYRNVADGDDDGSAGYWELAKKSKDPNNEKQPASEILREANLI
jgi:hypothetical protein